MLKDRDSTFLTYWLLLGANAITWWFVALMFVGIRNNWWWNSIW